MAQVVRLRQNPNDPAQFYAVWDTGRVDAHGGALPILDGPRFFELPRTPGCDIHLTDWAGPSGYVLEDGGGFHAFGSAPDVGLGDFPEEMPGVPLSFIRKYVGFEWDPNLPGQGYVCDVYGQLFAFGGATPPNRLGALLADPVVKCFRMQFSPPFKRALLMYYGGGRNQDWPFKTLPADGYFEPGRDWVRDTIVTNWGTFSGVDPSGYILVASGIVHEFGPNPPQDAFGGPFVGNAGTQVGLAILQPTNPLTLQQVATLGQLSAPYTASTPPTVTAGGGFGQMPPAVVVDTTRPLLGWTYSDPQKDKQRQWQLVVWPQSYVNVNDMTNPRLNRGQSTFQAEGSDLTTRGVTPSIDLPNGSYVLYVRAQDTSERWSLWSSRAWTQDVPVPATPTGLTASLDVYRVHLVLTTPTVDGNFAVFEYSDDAGLSWLPVRGAAAAPLAAVTRATDYDIRLQVPRTYRARAYYVAPRTISEPSPERTVTVVPPVGERLGDYVITSCDDPELGGKFDVFDLTMSRPRNVGVHQPLASHYPIVIDDGGAKAREGSVGVRTLDRADYERLAALVSPAHTLLIRDQFGQAIYCRVSGTWDDPLMYAAPLLEETTGLRHAHEHTIPLHEVALPTALPAED